MLPAIRKCPQCKKLLMEGDVVSPIMAEVEFGPSDIAVVSAEFHDSCLEEMGPSGVMLAMYEAAEQSRRVKNLIENHPDRTARRENAHLN